jgi:methylenetetrahydrofolate dehydrogenase (NADP+) / methenyltetrahydrofolate cyclohydrolase
MVLVSRRPDETMAHGANGSGRVTATLMDGEALAARLLAETADAVAGLGRVGFATVLAADDDRSHAYVNRKHEAVAQAGVEHHDHRLAGTASEDELLGLIADLNADDSVDAIFVQLPLPGHVDPDRVTEALDPAKDVDGLHPLNRGRLLLGDEAGAPATPLAVLALLREYGVELEGANAAVVGPGPFLGTPTALLLMARNATVTVCDPADPGLARYTRTADVVVATANVPNSVGAELLRPSAAVVDAGLDGDVDPAAADRAGLLSRVPGGVGPVTIPMLLRNVVRAARRRRDQHR